MNTRSTATGTTAALVPGAIIVGVGLLVSSVVGLRADRDHYRAAAARPRPTVTETKTTTAPVAGRTTVPAAPSSSPSAGAGSTVVQAGDSTRTAGGVAEDQAGASSSRGGWLAGQSSPTSQSPATSSCGGAVLSVRLPLGALPRCTVTAGGTR